MSKPKVLITGVTGYLGSTCAKVFVEDGTYDVYGTVRSKTNQKKIGPLLEQIEKNSITLVEADLLKEQSLNDAIKGMDFVVHTASPFPLAAPKHEDDIIKPAVEGTRAVMRACLEHGIKRIVLTSSTVSIMGQLPQDQKPIYDHNDWSNTKACDPYGKSKTLAEKAAWDFISELQDDQKFELVTVNPGLILGPMFIKETFTSQELVTQMITGKMGGFPKIQIPSVDVRDVALIHLKGLQTPEAAGKRLVAVAQPLTFSEISQHLTDKYYPKYPVTRNQVPYCLLYLVSFFDKQASTMLKYWGKPQNVSAQQTKDILGIEFKSYQTSLDDMVVALEEQGHISPKDKK